MGTKADKFLDDCSMYLLLAGIAAIQTFGVADGLWADDRLRPWLENVQSSRLEWALALTIWCVLLVGWILFYHLFWPRLKPLLKAWAARWLGDY